MTKFNDDYRNVCEKLGWEVFDEFDDRIDLLKYSPAGEDFSFSIDTENFVEGVKEYAAHFNIDEHIEMWIIARKNGMRGVPSTRELVKDAEDIYAMLRDLAVVIARLEVEMEVKRK